MGDTWYYAAGGKSVGPHTLEDIQQLMASGIIKPADHVCSDGQTWERAGDVRVLQATPAPVTTHLGYSSPPGGPLVTFRAAELLKQAGGWAYISAIMLFISCGLMILVGLLCIVVGAVGMGAARPQFTTVLGGVYYLIMGGLFIPAAVLLFRHATRAKAFARVRTEQTLEQALDAHRAYWKYITILTFTMIGLIILSCIGGMIFGFMAAAARR